MISEFIIKSLKLTPNITPAFQLRPAHSGKSCHNYFTMLWIVLSLIAAHAAVDNDKVTNLPYAPVQPAFNLYSGYLSLPNSGGKKYHYVFAESQNDPAKSPVVLWLNGGPGCSSMDGFFYENGPYYFEENSDQMTQNPYSWNINANMLYFEAPVGVGFSIAGSPDNLKTNDAKTAADNLAALVQFFTAYPEYKTNEFYISGESYGGIYVPMLAEQVLLNNAANPDQAINLQGILVGNGATDWKYDVGSAIPEFAWGHGLINEEDWNKWNDNKCNFLDVLNNKQPCVDTLNKANDQFVKLNIYDIYRDCINNTTSKNIFMNVDPLKVAIPCVDGKGLTDYLNRDDVRTAFHVKDEFQDTWAICTDQVQYDIGYQTGSIGAYTNTLLKSSIRIWVYSGDTDSSVPTIGTRNWINSLNRSISQNWRQWFVPGDIQVSGYVITYDRITFLTIKGTGHMSIQWKRPQGKHMFASFVNGAVL